jgi:hypothetical protein
MDKFGSIPIPQTEYQTNLKDLSVSPIEQWLHAFTLDNHDQDTVELLGQEIFTLFKEWATNNGINYDVNCVKLGVRIANLKLSAITKGKHTKKGETKIFDIRALKKHFKIGLIVDFRNQHNHDDEIDE